MKSYQKILPILGIILGLLGLLLALSFTTINACQLANVDALSIKKHTQTALKTNSLEMARYHAFKALNGMEKARANFSDCGCEPALKTVKDAEMHLKNATRSKSLEDSKSYLKLALQNTLVAIDALKRFEEEYTSNYGDDILVMNTKEVLNEQGGILLTPAKQLQRTMEKSLAEFENSLDAVVNYVDCEDAFSFINRIVSKSNAHLERKTLTQAQHKYHLEVRTIALDALLKLEGCPKK